jgi:hypothetical protein
MLAIPLFQELSPIFLLPMVWFVLFSAISGVTIYRIVTLGKEKERHINEQRIRVGFCFIMLALELFFLVFIFAGGIFHFIPTARGGGDFSRGDHVIVGLKQDAAITFPQKLIASYGTNSAVTTALVLIEATSDSIFLADPAENDGPRKWRTASIYRPHVMEIRRAETIFIEHGERESRPVLPKPTASPALSKPTVQPASPKPTATPHSNSPIQSQKQQH